MLSRVDLDALVFIAMPRVGQEGSAKRMAEEIESLAFRGLRSALLWPRSRTEFFASLYETLGLVQNAWHPIIQIDCHGSKENGLEVGESGEFVSWGELVGGLRQVNVATKNNLVVILSACHAFRSVVFLPVDQHVPYYALFAPEEEIREGEVESRLIRFYSVLIESPKFEELYLALSPAFSFYHCERVFLQSYANYVEKYCRGAPKRARIEELLTRKIASSSLPNTRQNRKVWRDDIKRHINPSQESLDFLAKLFLGEREFCGNMMQVREYMRKSAQV